jgi:hypothetical protein
MSSKVAPLPGFVSIGSVRPSTAVSTSRPGTAPEGQDVVFYNDRSVVESQFDLARPRTAAETQEADTLHFLQTPWVAPNLQKVLVCPELRPRREPRGNRADRRVVL